MTAPDDTVSLTVNGIVYAGWKAVRIEAGVERAARSFEVEVTRVFPGLKGELNRIVPGNLCEVRIGADLVCTGYVDATPIEYDAMGISYVIRGRSKTADLVDSSADNSGGQWRGVSADKIIKALAGQYGINVIVQASPGEPIIDHQIEQGETVFESMDRLAVARHILITDDAAGNLVMAQPGSAGRATTALVLGENILSANCGYDYSEVYGEYIVKGQRSGTDELFGEAVAATKGIAQDHTITRRRSIIIQQGGQVDQAAASARAGYEAKLRNAKAQEARYTVTGWRQGDGKLWLVNQTVKIKDGIIGIDGDRLVTGVNFTLDSRGMITELVVLEASALTAAQDIKAAETEKTGKAGGIDWGR
jgi:prophage tail gpP-like protein